MNQRRIGVSRSRAKSSNGSLLGLLVARTQTWHKILVFLIAAGAVGSGLSWFERTYGPVGGTMGWLRLIDMTRHEDRHELQVKKAVEPVSTKVDDISGKLDAIKEERIYFNYKQTSWDIQALEAELAKKGALSQKDYERLVDLRTENARLKRWLEKRPIQ